MRNICLAGTLTGFLVVLILLPTQESGLVKLSIFLFYSHVLSPGEDLDPDDLLYDMEPQNSLSPETMSSSTTTSTSTKKKKPKKPKKAAVVRE